MGLTMADRTVSDSPILRKIGVLRSGEVDLVTDTSLSRKTALDLLAAEFLCEYLACGRFQTAIKVADIEHPCIGRGSDVAQTVEG